MKRQSDGWVNATHILKVANFDKPQRTRILEREVQRGTHEKIQGGYGKYQGTWVPLERARAVAEQYKVLEILEPLFAYSPSDTDPTPFAPRHTWKSRSTNGAAGRGGGVAGTPSGRADFTPITARRGASRQSSSASASNIADAGIEDTSLVDNGLKRPYRVLSSGRGGANNGGDGQGAVEGNMLAPPVKKRRGRPPSSSSASLAKRSDSGPRKFHYGIPPSTPKQNIISSKSVNSARYDGNNETLSPESSSISSRSSSPSDFMSESDIDAALTNGVDTPSARNAILASKRRTPSMITDSPQFNYNGYEQRQYTIPDRYQDSPQQSMSGAGNHSMLHSSIQPHHQNLQHQQAEHQRQMQQQHPQQGHQRNISTASTSSEMLSTMYSNRLLDYFTSIDEAEIPQFLINPPPEFKINQVIDDEGHTAFHWACSMGDLKIIEVLLQAGANISATNFAEQTPLIRSILFTNNYDRRTFPKVVDLLRDTILYVDSHKQTVLHHIASTTSSRSKLSSTRYYTEIILAKLLEIKSLQVVTDFVNLQDENGDTALHIAARNGARKCVKVLFHYNARADIVNNNGRTTQEYISEYEAQRQQLLKQADGLVQVKSNTLPGQISSNGQAAVNGYGQSNGTPSNKYMLGKPNSNRELNAAPSQFDSNYRDINGSGSGEANGNANGTVYPAIGNPHVSEVAISATQRVAPSIIEGLEELALAYDSELQEKDSDIEQVRHLLESMKREITETENAIEEIGELPGDEQVVQARLQQSNELVNQRAMHLRKLLERTQSRDLAMLVQAEEDRAGAELQTREPTLNGTATTAPSEVDPKEEVLSLASTLADLQKRRGKLVDEIVELCASAGAGEKMNDYRRLVSLSCGVKVEEIDELLDGIAQALLADGGGSDGDD
ncbi:transcription factor MBP1 [Sugiyamaella lignohabitans]|uniref:Transcription factor MBP1 n=1 Tax=Sugiyamaella lignohabitans TaxID=796027 RepID=A0A167CKN4_9ASCO|nr:transcription factor MBP1 [Sugiyamaella lignohabitans]ANB11816.1 transcription factor MBP1 [Sugiyamaella lignohabitans]